jgi:hypothetical protein
MAIKKTTKKKTTTRKKWVNSNKPSFDGHTFESDRELSMYKLLKKAGIPFTYIGKENAKYELLEEFHYKGGCYERAQKRSKALKDNQKVSKTGYTPDFVGENESWFIEVKGRKLGDFSLRWKLFKHKVSERTPPPVLFMPVTIEDCQQVVQILKQEGYATKQD